MLHLETKAFHKVLHLYETQYNEEIDALYNYMNSFINKSNDLYLFKDEIENYTGMKEHEDIVRYIINI